MLRAVRNCGSPALLLMILVCVHTHVHMIWYEVTRHAGMRDTTPDGTPHSRDSRADFTHGWSVQSAHLFFLVSIMNACDLSRDRRASFCLVVSGWLRPVLFLR